MQAKIISINKNKIALSFTKAASSYDDNALIQKVIADKLLAKVNPTIVQNRVLDLGSGTGYCTDKLRLMFPAAEIVSIDIAEGMLLFARGDKKENSYVCADAEKLPFLSNSFDMVVSSLAIQWCKSHVNLFSELYRVLNDQGSIYMSTFGPSTLQELKLAWKGVDSYMHVNNFVSRDSIEKGIALNSFSRINVQEEELVEFYPSFMSLGKELKAIGAHNMNQAQSGGLTGRKKIRKLQDNFEKNRVIGKGIPVTYAAQYISIRK